MFNKPNKAQLDHRGDSNVLYLACPYAHSDVEVKCMRHQAVNYYAQQYLLSGKFVYSPLTHNIPLHHPGIEHTWEVWAAFDKAMLSRCNELVVLKLDGWKESVGVSAEIKFAETLAIPVTYVEPDKNILERFITVTT